MPATRQRIVGDQRRWYTELGLRIAIVREAKGRTQAQLAQRIGLSRVSVVNIEQGRQRVYADTLATIADALGVKVAKLLPRTDTGRVG